MARPRHPPKPKFALSRAYLVEHEALALPRAAADGDHADGALDELQRRHRLGVHHELALLIAVHQPQRPRGARRRVAIPASGGGRVAGARAPPAGAPAEAEHLQHREFADGGKGPVTLVFCFQKWEEGRGIAASSALGGLRNEATRLGSRCVGMTLGAATGTRLPIGPHALCPPW